MTDEANTLVARVTALFADELHVQVPSADTDLLATGRLDSLGVIELIMKLEGTFGITVDMEQLEVDYFRTIDSIADFVARELAVQERPVGS